MSPLPKSTVNAGSTLPIKFQLQNAAGNPISDAEAQSLVSPSCKIAIILVKPAGAVSGCPSYADRPAPRLGGAWDPFVVVRR